MFLSLAVVAAFIAPAGAQQFIRIGVTGGPGAQIIEQVVPEAKKLGLDLKIIEFSDYIIPNQALAGKEIEANSFQHEPYLKNQVAKTSWKLVKLAETMTAPLGVYSKKYKTFAEIPDGASVAIQNDPTNGSRPLRLLHDNNIIKLRDGVGVTAGVTDIVENPHRYRFIELDAAQLSRSLDDVAAASINNNYAVQAGLDPVKDPILREGPNSPWVNIIAVREEDKDKPWAALLVKAFHTQSVKDYVLREFKGSLIPAW
ncbi:MetQ/NlpA family ABC transporter substrate-binding protein [Variibacter gotjawalensis]|nr:MetQ/NlpA family ABC transporter substrate-binding protein [Variibacter gotjawalensis]